MLTDAQVYCMTSMIYLFRPPLTAKAIYRKSKVVHLITQRKMLQGRKRHFVIFL